jgi:glyoxylase-like metal-dependent hydrolase (beta-lactamase superfamily II)
MEIVPDVHMIEGINAHCYLIVDKDITLIDTGLPHNTKKILSYITNELHRKPSELTTIILTHSHYDHIGNAEELRTITKAKIAAHPEDALFIERKKQPPLPSGGMGILFKVLSPVIKVQPFHVDILLKENEEIAGLITLYSPGHSPGSICLYDPKRKVLFTGDTLRYKNESIEGPSKNFSLDLVSAYTSIQKLQTLDFEVMLSGHGTPLIGNASVKVREFIANQKDIKNT